MSPAASSGMQRAGREPQVGGPLLCVPDLDACAWLSAQLVPPLAEGTLRARAAKTPPADLMDAAQWWLYRLAVLEVVACQRPDWRVARDWERVKCRLAERSSRENACPRPGSQVDQASPPAAERHPTASQVPNPAGSLVEDVCRLVEMLVTGSCRDDAGAEAKDGRDGGASASLANDFPTRAAGQRLRAFTPLTEEAMARAVALLERLPDAERNRIWQVPLLGLLHEYLLQCRLEAVATSPGWKLVEDKRSRRAQGAFFTPLQLVERVVAQSLAGPLADFGQQLADCDSAEDTWNALQRLFLFRIVDPAMGAGFFLLAAVRQLAEQLAPKILHHQAVITRLRCAATARGPAAAGDAHAGDAHAGAPPVAELRQLHDALKRILAEQVVCGVDLNPDAVELAAVGLWLETAAEEPLNAFRWRLAVGDSLFGPGPHVGPSDPSPELAAEAGFNWHRHLPASPGGDPGNSAGFHLVLGNPPYLGHRRDLKAARFRRFQVCRSGPNLAAAFVERSLGLLRSGGVCALVLPKAFQYVRAWSETRELLADGGFQLETLIDVEVAFPGVLLEQCVVSIRRTSASASGYTGQLLLPADSRPTLPAGASEPVNGTEDASFHVSANAAESWRTISCTVPMQLTEALACFPACLASESFSLWEHLQRAGPLLGEVSETCQALGYQAELVERVEAHAQRPAECGTGAAGRPDHPREDVDPGVPILRGREIRPMWYASPASRVRSSALVSRRDGRLKPKVQRLQQPKVVSQNIVAHVTLPAPRIWVVSAPDPAGLLCLNTVSATWISDPRFSIQYVAAVLNSSLASWFLREFVFCRAVRTMHLDRHYVGRLPLAVPSPAIQRRCLALCDTCPTIQSNAARQRAIDEVVFDAYRLTDLQRTFILSYCYGKSFSSRGG